MNTQSPQGAPPRSAAQSPPPGKKPGAGESASEAFGDAVTRISEIREYLLYYLSVQADAAKLAVRKAVLFAVLGVVALLAAGAAVVMAVVLLMTGVANVLGELFGGRFWLGDLVVGIVFLGILAIGAKIGISAVTGSSRKKTVKKYESRKHQQRVHFGHDVKQRAQDA